MSYWIVFSCSWQSHIFLLNCDVCCNFPLSEMLGRLSFIFCCPFGKIIVVKFKFLVGILLLWFIVVENLISFAILFSVADTHKRYGGIGTLLVVKVILRRLCSLLLTDYQILAYAWFYSGIDLQVSDEAANQFGAVVADPVTNELLHYTEKPETFVGLIAQQLNETFSTFYSEEVCLLFSFLCVSG